MSTKKKIIQVVVHLFVFTCPCRTAQHYKWSVAASSADTSDCCCNGFCLRTWTGSNERCFIFPYHYSSFFNVVKTVSSVIHI